jgi:hypothetical protein
MDYPCEHVVAIEDEPRHHLVIANEYVRAFVVEIAPHDRTLCHHHPHDYLLYVAGEAEIVSAARGEEPKRLSYRDGECELSEAGLTHVVANLSEAPFRNVVAELLPRGRALQRGLRPNVIAPVGRVIEALNEIHAAIYVAELEAGGEVEIAGPAIVATPYNKPLKADELDGIDVEAHPICDMAWVPPQTSAVLWGSQLGIERAVIFQLGYSDEAVSSVANNTQPVRSLRAHAEEPDQD